MKPGSYKAFIVDGLRKLGSITLAGMFERGEVKLGVVSSITGNVTVRKDIVPECIGALEAAGNKEAITWYVPKLLHGEIVPCMTVGVDYVAMGGQTVEENLQKQKGALKAAGVKTEWAPGELYLKS